MYIWICEDSWAVFVFLFLFVHICICIVKAAWLYLYFYLYLFFIVKAAWLYLYLYVYLFFFVFYLYLYCKGSLAGGHLSWKPHLLQLGCTLLIAGGWISHQPWWRGELEKSSGTGPTHPQKAKERGTSSVISSVRSSLRTHAPLLIHRHLAQEITNVSTTYVPHIYGQKPLLFKLLLGKNPSNSPFLAYTFVLLTVVSFLFFFGTFR